MRDENGNLHDEWTAETYLTKIPSYASTRALNYQKEAALKFCRRYRRAINDGTIHGMSFWNSEAGENNWTARYYNAQGQGRDFLGDFSEVNRNGFMAFLQARFGSIQQLNAKLGTTIREYSLSVFGVNMILNNGEGANHKLRALWEYYCIYMHAQYNNAIQEHIYNNLNITRAKIFWFDVGSLMNGESGRMKAYLWKTRTDISDHFIVVKSNNITEFNGDDFGIAQINSAARRAGAVGVMEPSPAMMYFVSSNRQHIVEVVNKLYAAGLGLSAFTPQDATFWPGVAQVTNLDSHNQTKKANDLVNGVPVTLYIKFEDLFLDGNYDISWKLESAWRNARQANPNTIVTIFVDDAGIKSWFNYPLPEDQNTNPGGGGGEEESDVREVNPLSDVSLSAVPTYSLPAGAINMTADAVPWATQVDYAKRGMINYVNPGRLADERGGIYHPQYNPQGITEAALQQELASYNLPANVSLYRMMYANAVSDIWPDNSSAPTSQQALNERVEGFAIGYRNSLGWTNHPIVLDIDFEDGRFFTYAGVKAQADAIKYLLSRNANVRVQVYASAHNNLSVDGGGSASNPNAQLGPAERFRLFKEAGVSLFQGTIPYFHVPSFFWTDPSHEPSVIGSGKLYSSHADYAKKSLHPIVAKLGWTDNYFGSIPAGHTPANIEWIMAVYEGGDDGLTRQYDQQGNWISGLNWPEVGGWILESLPTWGVVTGSYRYGGGVYNWSDGRPRKAGQDHLEAGKWRAYQFNRFSNNPSTQYNIKLEYSIDGGNIWQNDSRSGENLLQEHSNPKPYVRGAYSNGELLIVAVAGQPFHVNGQSQSIKIRYKGKQIAVNLQPQKVHSFTVSI